MEKKTVAKGKAHKGADQKLPKGIFIKNGKHWVCYVDLEGKYVRRVAGTLKQAQELLTVVRAELLQGRHEFRIGRRSIKPEVTTVESLIDKYMPQILNRKKQQREDVRYAAFWKEQIGKEDAKSSDLPDMIEAVKISLCQPDEEGKIKKRSTVNRYLSNLRAVFTLAFERGKLDRHPMASVKQFCERGFVRTRVLEPEEEDKLLKAFDQTGKDLISLAMFTGMREGNLFGLRWDQVSLSSETAVVMDKSGEPHVFYLSPEAMAILKRRKRDEEKAVSAGKKASPFVFPGERNRETCINGHNWYTRRFFKTVKALGLPPLRFHDLKRTYVSRALDAGVGIKTVQALVGHKTLEITSRVYSNMEPNQLRRASKQATKART